MIRPNLPEEFVYLRIVERVIGENFQRLLLTRLTETSFLTLDVIPRKRHYNSRYFIQFNWWHRICPPDLSWRFRSKELSLLWNPTTVLGKILNLRPTPQTDLLHRYVPSTYVSGDSRTRLHILCVTISFLPGWNFGLSTKVSVPFPLIIESPHKIFIYYSSYLLVGISSKTVPDPPTKLHSLYWKVLPYEFPKFLF